MACTCHYVIGEFRFQMRNWKFGKPQNAKVSFQIKAVTLSLSLSLSLFLKIIIPATLFLLSPRPKNRFLASIWYVNHDYGYNFLFFNQLKLRIWPKELFVSLCFDVNLTWIKLLSKLLWIFLPGLILRFFQFNLKLM